MPELATAYWDYRHDIAVIDGIIVKNQRIVVPQKMRECLLQKLHRVHQGVDKSIQRARNKWSRPGMTEQIRRLILTCPSCTEHQPRQKQAAVTPVITTNAMQILGCDIFQYAGRWYSCNVDWLPYGGSERSRLTIYFQRLPRTLLEVQHHPQGGDPSLSVEKRPLRKCYWET